MTRDEELDHLERKHHRDAKIRRVLMWVLMVALVGAVVYALSMGSSRQRQIDALQSQASESDSAAVEVAEQRQQQARTADGS